MFVPSSPAEREAILAEVVGGRTVMEDAGRPEVFTCTWEGRRRTGRDVMGLKEWEQESHGGGKKKEEWGWEIRAEVPRGCCSTSHSVRL